MNRQLVIDQPTWEAETAREKPPAKGYDDRRECGHCDGQGMFIAVVDGVEGYVKCGRCAASGLRGAR